jgi:hypothetical protein
LASAIENKQEKASKFGLEKEREKATCESVPRTTHTKEFDHAVFGRHLLLSLVHLLLCNLKLQSLNTALMFQTDICRHLGVLAQ